jgi:hypothetical protein
VYQVSELGSRALAVSLPFSCVLGFLSSMIAATMGKLASFCALAFQCKFAFLNVLYSGWLVFGNEIWILSKCNA